MRYHEVIIMACLGTKIQSSTCFSSHSRKLLHPRAPKISTSTMQGQSKRPICPSCSKPTQTCLCSRILTPALQNSVHVTILQHTLERKHPLNSTRIAILGLKNLTVATVSDVNFQARFLIRLLDPNSQSGCPGNVPNGFFSPRSWETGDTQKLLSEKDSNLIHNDSAAKCGLRDDVGDVLDSHAHIEVVKQVSISDGAVMDDEVEKNANGDLTGSVHEENGRLGITVTIGKYGAISSLSHIWMAQARCQLPNLSFDNILACPEACEALSKGFLVNKFQRKQLNRDEELEEECEEFELEVGSGSVLLFPSDKAVTISDLDATGFEVKNLIVLDGTWAKAKRIYSENPWLNILPHVKLEVNETSLYSDVRHQPKAGYLSTIESIIFALKTVGELNREGLDGLLDTFESMVGDQRRFKEERLSKHLST